METLDVKALPGIAWHEQDEAAQAMVIRLRYNIEQLADSKLIKYNRSFGFAASYPVMPGFTWDNWDDPHDFVWFVCGWGPEGDRYIANAVRKLRPALRHGKDTMELRLTQPNAFERTVESQEADGSFAWGDFPWGGACLVNFGGVIYPMSVSCLREVEDDAVSKMIGGFTGAQHLKNTNPDEFNASS